MAASHRVAFYADTHYRRDGSAAYWAPPPNLDVEALLLGGDNHYLPEHLGGLVRGIRAVLPEEAAIVVVPGNGDYIDQELSASRAANRAAVESVANAVYLDDETVTLPSGLRIIGSTLWSHVPDELMDPYHGIMAAHGMQGVDDIRVDGRYITFADTNTFHAESRAYIEQELRALSADERRETIVCTHFWPTLRWVDPANAEHAKWHRMVGTDLDDMIAAVGPCLWLCGHLHETQTVAIGDTLISSNPRAGDGPGNINPAFLETNIIEL